MVVKEKDVKGKKPLKTKKKTSKKKIKKDTVQDKQIKELKKKLKELTAKFLNKQKKTLPASKYKPLDKKMRSLVDRTNDQTALKKLISSFSGGGSKTPPSIPNPSTFTSLPNSLNKALVKGAEKVGGKDFGQKVGNISSVYDKLKDKNFSELTADELIILAKAGKDIYEVGKVVGKQIGGNLKDTYDFLKGYFKGDTPTPTPTPETTPPETTPPPPPTPPTPPEEPEPEPMPPPPPPPQMDEELERDLKQAGSGFGQLPVMLATAGAIGLGVYSGKDHFSKLWSSIPPMRERGAEERARLVAGNDMRVGNNDRLGSIDEPLEDIYTRADADIGDFVSRSNRNTGGDSLDELRANLQNQMDNMDTDDEFIINTDSEVDDPELDPLSSDSDEEMVRDRNIEDVFLEQMDRAGLLGRVVRDRQSTPRRPGSRRLA